MKYKVNFKAMSTKEKIDYIWGYYRWHILVIISGIVIIVSTVLQAVTYREPLLSVIMLNSYGSMSDATCSGFEDFFEIYGYEFFEGAVELKQDLYFHGDNENSYEDYRNYEMLLALLMSGDFELFFGTGEIYKEFADQGFFLNLSDVLSQSALECYEEYLIYTNDMGDAEAYPYAIDLSGNQWLSNNNYYHDKCYFGVLKNSNTNKVAAEFAEFLLMYQ